MEKLGINPVLIITQIINFLIVFFLLTKLLYKPILAMLEKRKQQVVATNELQVHLEQEKGHMQEEKKKIIKEPKSVSNK